MTIARINHYCADEYRLILLQRKFNFQLNYFFDCINFLVLSIERFIRLGYNTVCLFKSVYHFLSKCDVNWFKKNKDRRSVRS